MVGLAAMSVWNSYRLAAPVFSAVASAPQSFSAVSVPSGFSAMAVIASEFSAVSGSRSLRGSVASTGGGSSPILRAIPGR
jgi:hypothetical protein